MKNYLPPSCYYCLTSLYHLLTASSHFFMDLDWVEEWSLPEIPKLMSKGAAVLAETMLEGSAVGGIKNWEDIYFRLQVSLRPFLGSRKKSANNKKSKSRDNIKRINIFVVWSSAEPIPPPFICRRPLWSLVCNFSEAFLTSRVLKCKADLQSAGAEGWLTVLWHTLVRQW